jgi:hypothetical protein
MFQIEFSLAAKIVIQRRTEWQASTIFADSTTLVARPFDPELVGAPNFIDALFA